MSDPWEHMMFAPPSAASSHLDDGDLFTVSTPAQVKHLADCAWCRGRQDSALAASGAVSETDEDFERVLQAGRWRDEFEQVSREAVLPDKVRVLMSAPSPVGDVEPGQIWRLTWRGYHLLVAVIDIADWQVLSAPVTTDVSLADEFTLLVEAGQSPLAAGLAIWVRSRAAIPLFVFERPVGPLPPVDNARLTGQAAIKQLVRAHLSGSAAPSHLPVGSPLTENDVDRLAMHDALWDQTGWFAGAGAGLVYPDGCLASTGSLSSTDEGPKWPLPDLLRDCGLTLRQLADQTGIEMSRLVDLSRRGATASANEVIAIEMATSRGVEIDQSYLQLKTVTALTEVSRPAWRAARQRWTKDNDRDAEAEDPAPLVTHLVQQPIAARSIDHGHTAADRQQQLRQYWRERVTMLLSDYA
jgi:hypothetical protein